MTGQQIKTYKSLISFLKKEYKYMSVDKKIKSSKVILVNKALDNQLVQIEVEGSNETWSEFEINAVKNWIQEGVKPLRIIITEKELSIVEKKYETIIKTTPDQLKNSLYKYFPAINKINDKYLGNIYISKEEALKEESDEIKINNLKVVMNKIKNNNIQFTWIILVFFIILPAAFTIIGSVMGVGLLEHLTPNGKTSYDYAPNAAAIIFGGTNQTITVMGGQWWRILTYGFSAIDAGAGGSIVMNIFLIFIISTALFSLSRLTEIVIGNFFKLAIPFVLSYIFLGFIVSTTLPYTTTSGSLPILGIMVGILIMFNSGEKTPIAAFSKAKVVWPLLLIILFIVSSEDQASSFSVLVTGIIMGSIFSLLCKSPIKEWTWKENSFILLLLVFLVIGIVFAVISKDTPAYNYDVLAALQFYGKNKIGGGYETMNAIVNKIGWNGSFNANSQWTQNIITPLSSVQTPSLVLKELDFNLFKEKFNTWDKII